MKQEESILAEKVASYLKIQYPNLIYRFDIADLKLTMPQAMRNKTLQMKERGYPDLTILFPLKGFHGLLIELKKDKSEVYKKDGTFKRKVNTKTRKCHIQEQHNMHERLRALNYCVEWGFGFQDTIDKINIYLGKKL